MSDKNVDKWKQKGHLYLWRYLENARNYPDWNLAADADFRRSFADLAERMVTAQYNCQQSIAVTAPTKEIFSIPNNRGGQSEWKSPDLIIFKHSKDDLYENIFSFDETTDAVILCANSEKLSLLGNCLSKPTIDYSIKIGNSQIWFW